MFLCLYMLYSNVNLEVTVNMYGQHIYSLDLARSEKQFVTLLHKKRSLVSLPISLSAVTFIP